MELVMGMVVGCEGGASGSNNHRRRLMMMGKVAAK